MPSSPAGHPSAAHAIRPSPRPRAALALAALAAALIWMSGPAARARGKGGDWPEITEAETSLTSVPGAPGAPAVLLRNTRDGKIVPRGRYLANVMNYHWRLKVLKDEGRDYARVEIPANKWSTVEDIRARTVKPDGTVVPVPEDQIFEKVVRKARGVRETAFVFSFPAVEPGAILEYRYVRTARSLILVDPWWFSSRVFTVLSRVSQAMPAEAHYAALCDKCPDPEPRQSDWHEHKIHGRRYTIEMHDVPANADEILMPPPRAAYPRFEMTLRGWDYAHWDELGRDGALFTDWDSVARFFDFRYRHSYMLDTVDLGRVVAEWTSGLPDLDARIRAVFRHVRSDFRYVDANYVVASTRSIADILKTRSADNEEKAVLLTAALHSLGLEPRIALVAGRDHGPLYENYVSPTQFSHAVVALPRADGSLEWMDPTATWVPYGVLPWRDSGAGALLLDPHGARLTSLPKAQAASSTHATLTVTPEPAGQAAIDAVIEMRGDDAFDMRGDLAPESADERKADLQDWLGDRLSGATLKGATIEDLEVIDRPLRMHLEIEAPGLVTRAEDVMTLRACVLGCYATNPISRGDRTLPIYIDSGMKDEEIVTLKPAEGFHATAMPPEGRAFSALGTLNFKCVPGDDGSVTCTRIMNLPPGRWPPTQGSALRTLFEKIVDIDRTAVAFSVAAASVPGPATGG